MIWRPLPSSLRCVEPVSPGVYCSPPQVRCATPTDCLTIFVSPDLCLFLSFSHTISISRCLSLSLSLAISASHRLCFSRSSSLATSASHHLARSPSFSPTGHLGLFLVQHLCLSPSLPLTVFFAHGRRLCLSLSLPLKLTIFGLSHDVARSPSVYFLASLTIPVSHHL